jgi:signal transduction histidine kinase
LTDAALAGVETCKILLIDDEEPNLRLLERVLIRAGYDSFRSTTDSSKAAALFADFQPDLVLTDWLMPNVDGCTVIESLRALTGTDDYLPIVVLTADITAQARTRALAAGATDFLTKPFDQVEVLLRLRNLLQARRSHLIIRAQNATLEESVRTRTIELEAALNELRQTQKQVIQQERLAALGAMAGGIAHDFNNALSIIMGFGEILLRDSEHGLTRESAAPSITTILTAAEDGAKIVHRLREFYRPDEVEDQHLPVDLNHLIEQAISLTRPRWLTGATAGGQEIMVTTELGAIVPVIGDAAELREALTNLIFNAVDALPLGGKITFSTRCAGETVVLTVRDSGTGMSEEVRQRCLEPFFTTKGKHGSGLGLAMVFGIIARHSGTIDIQSELGSGTAFALTFPAARDERLMVSGVAPTLQGPWRILVVDDQPVLCQLVCEHLKDDLHTVEAAQSGNDALEKFRVAHFDLVITDYVMAEMTGEKFAIEVKKLNPETKVILLTGYGGDRVPGKMNCAAIDLIVAKPLSRAALRRACAKVMLSVAS